MGYTHYWGIRKPNAIMEALPYVAEDLKTLLPKLPPLAGWDGEGEPLITEQEINFNGVKPDECENLYLGPDINKTFCKTQRKLYDLAVQATLVLLKYHSAELNKRPWESFYSIPVSIASDGSLYDWVKACKLVESLGYKVNPAWVLGRELWKVEDWEGRTLYFEWNPYHGKPADYVRSLQRHFKPDSLRGPYSMYPPEQLIDGGKRIYLER